MAHIISRCIGMMAARAATGAAGSAYHRYSHSKPAMKRVAARIYPTARAFRFPYSNPIVQTIAARIYPIGRAFLDTAYRMIKSWVPKMPLLWSMPLLASFPYVNVEKIEGQEKIERIVYPFLFRVTGKDILPDQQVYILGMRHCFKEADYPPEALALIKSCNLLLSEFPAQMASSKNPEEWALQYGINKYLYIHKKLLSVDEQWIETHIKAYEATTGEVNMDTLIPELREKSSAIKADQAYWLNRLSLADQTKAQTLLDRCGLQLSDLDPISVNFSLLAINDVENHYDFNTGEIAIIKNFQERNCPIIQLEDELSDMAEDFDAGMDDILDYDLESKLKRILSKLEPQVEKVDEVQQGIQELQNEAEDLVFPFLFCNDEDSEECIEFKTVEAFRNHWSLVQEARKQHLLRSIFDDKIYFNIEEFEERMQASHYLRWAMDHRNNTWYPKIPLAIQQKKDTAIICGGGHLFGETGMVRSLRRDGYDVNHVKSLEE